MLENVQEQVSHHQRDDGVHEFVFHESTPVAVDEWATLLAEMLAGQYTPPPVRRWLFNVPQPGLPPFDEVISSTHRLFGHIQQVGHGLRIAYLTDVETFHTLLPSVNRIIGQRARAKWYNRHLDAYDHHDEAIQWLLATED